MNRKCNPGELKNASGQRSKRAVEVGFRELGNGLAEMIENPHDSTKSAFAIFENGEVRYAGTLGRGNHILVPIPKEGRIIRHVRLANGADSFHSIESLVGDVFLVLRATLDLPEKYLILLTCFVFSTWLIEKLPVAPYLALVGAPGCGKTTALRVLSLLCRRSLLTADVSSAAFYEVCDQMTTTLLIDEAASASNRRELLHIMRAGNTAGFVTLRKGDSFRSFGARVVSWIELPNDPALNSRCIIVPMTSSNRSDLLHPTDPHITKTAERLQRMLLMYRLANFQTLGTPRIPGEEVLQPRTRDLFRALALPMIKHPVACNCLLLLLKPQEALRELLSVYQVAALDSLFNAIHEVPEANSLRIKTLRDLCIENLRQRGESGLLSERKVGDILTSLSLTNRARTNAGYVLSLDRETREKIHSLAGTHGLNPPLVSYKSASCRECEAIGAARKPIVESLAIDAKSVEEHARHVKSKAPNQTSPDQTPESAVPRSNAEPPVKTMSTREGGVRRERRERSQEAVRRATSRCRHHRLNGARRTR